MTKLETIKQEEWLDRLSQKRDRDYDRFIDEFEECVPELIEMAHTLKGMCDTFIATASQKDEDPSEIDIKNVVDESSQFVKVVSSVMEMIVTNTNLPIPSIFQEIKDDCERKAKLSSEELKEIIKKQKRSGAMSRMQTYVSFMQSIVKQMDGLVESKTRISRSRRQMEG